MAGPFQAQLLSGASTNSQQITWPGGMGVFSVVATFAGGTVKLQFLGADGTTLVDAGVATTLTANGAGTFYLPQVNIQATLVGSPTGVFASVGRVVY